MKPRILLFSLALAAMPSALAQITNSLQAYWDFEGNASNNSEALGGTAYNGTLFGDAGVTGSAVKVGTGSLNLDGTGDYMGVNSITNVNQPWTVSAWFRPDLAPAGAARMMVYESRGAYAMSYGLREGTATADTNFQLFNQRTGGDLQGNLQVPDSASANQWHHIITSFTPSTPTTTGSLRGYLNGVLQYNITVPVNSTHGTSTGFNVGTYRNADGRWFDGAIDEVALWNSTLGAQDAYWIYNLGDRGFALSTPERVKADNLTDLTLGASWAGGIAPSPTEYATINASFTQNGAFTTGGNLSIAGLRLTDGTGPVEIHSPAHFLELGALGLDMAAATRDLTVANLSIAASQRWNIGTGTTFTVGATSNLTGPHSIVKWGGGTAIVLCDSSRTGDTTIAAGALQIGDDTTTGGLGSGNIILNNGVLTFKRSNEVALANPISGTGTLFQDGAGTLVLTGANSFAGLTDILPGSSLRLENPLALQNSTVTGGGLVFGESVAANAFTLGGISGSGNIILQNTDSAPVSLTVGNNNASTTFSGAISGTGSLVKSGTGTLTLATANTYTGGTLISSRRIHLADDNALGSGPVTVGPGTAYAATYSSGGAPFLAMTNTAEATLPNNIILPDPPSTGFYALQKFAASSTTGTNLTVSGTISGGGPNMVLQLDTPVTGDSTTTFTLSGNNTLSGLVRLNRGALILTNPNSLGNASLLVQTNANTSAGNLRFAGSFSLPNNITIGTANNTINTGSHSVTLAGNLGGSAAWRKIGSGTLTLGTKNTSTSPLTLVEGTLAIPAGASLFDTGDFFGGIGVTYVSIDAGATLETRNWAYGDNNAFNMLRANSYSVRVNGGTVRFTDTFSALRGFRVGPGGATLEVASGETFTKLQGSAASQNIIEGHESGGSLTLTGSGDGVIQDPLGSNGSWSPAAGIIKSGNGTWSLAGTNTLTGNFTVTAGKLRLESTGRLTFAITGTSNNQLAGDGSAEIDGQFFLDLSAADSTPGNSWPIAPLAGKTFGATFQVGSTLGTFTKAGTTHSLVDGGNTWSFNETTGLLTLSAGTGGSFESWIDGFFPGETDPEIIGPDADANGDGVANALVYLFGGDPKDGNNPSLLPTVTLATNPAGPVPNGNYLVFTYRRDTSANATVTVEHSTDLATPWTTATNGVDGVVIVETPNGFPPDLDKVEVFIPRSSASMFSRLSVIVP